MTTPHILLVVGLVFLAAATVRLAKDRWKITPRSKTWLIVGGVFVLVSLFIS